MNNKFEHKIISFIKFSPLILIIILSVITTSFLYYKHLEKLKEQKVLLKENYLQNQKLIMKEHVDRTIHKLTKNYEQIQKNTQKLLEDEISLAYSIVSSIYENNKDKYPKEDLSKLIVDAIKNIRFQNEDFYFFIFDTKGKGISHPKIENYENINLITQTDVNSKILIKDIIKNLEKKSTYTTTWKWAKITDSSKLYKKIGHFKIYKPLNWIIGTGVYEEDLKEEMKEKMINEISLINFDEKNGFISVYDIKNKKILSHRIKKYINQDIKKLISPIKGSTQDLEKKFLKPSNYVSFKFNNNHRLIYYKKFKQFQWALSSGFFYNEITKKLEETEKLYEKEFKENINALFVFSGVSTLVLLMFSIYFSEQIKRIFENYRLLIKRETKQKFTYILEKEKQYEDLFKKNRTIQLLIDPRNNKIIDTNHAAQQFYGYSEEEFLELKITNINTLSKEEIQLEMADAISCNRDFFIFKHKTKDKQIKDVKVFSVPSIYNNRTILHSSIFDITDEKIIENKLKISEDKFKNMFNLANIGMVIASTNKKFIHVNKKFEDIIGYKENELKEMSWIDITHPDDINKDLSKYQKGINGDINNFELEKRYIKKDGSIIDTIITVGFIKSNTEIHYVIASVLDVTKIKEKEKILLQQSKMASMGEMISNIAHQWRQPLSVISTAASGSKIERELGILTPEHEIEAFDTITKMTQHLSDTIEDFRTFFKHDKEESKFLVNDVYLKTMKLLESKLKNKEIDIIESIELIEINSYENDMVQILMNIILNAHDALEHKEDRKLIFINIYKKNEKLIIDIKDTAGGINKKIIDKIFEPYFTTKHQSQGTGIGLYMTEEIVVKHLLGKITVKNDTFTYEDKTYTGAKFRIIIPIS